MKRIVGSIAQRLAGHTDCHGPDECWLWHGAKNNNGYPQMRVRKVTMLATRLAYEEHHGVNLLRGQHVLHRCDTPLCLNPSHLFLGDPKSNSEDKVNKGRQAKGFALPHTRLSEDQVKEIRSATGSQGEIAARFGVSQPVVSRVKAGLRRGGVA